MILFSALIAINTLFLISHQGGLKAVVWTDVFQSAVMVGGLITVAVIGSVEVGGLSKVWEINERFNRTTFFEYETLAIEIISITQCQSYLSSRSHQFADFPRPLPYPLYGLCRHVRPPLVWLFSDYGLKKVSIFTILVCSRLCVSLWFGRIGS